MCDFRAGYNPAFIAKVKEKRKEEVRQAELKRLAKKASMREFERERNRRASEKLKLRRGGYSKYFTIEKMLLLSEPSISQGNWTMDEIADSICMVHQITRNQLSGFSRSPRFVLPRQQFCYWARSLTAFSTVQIGKVINRDHTTVLHSINKYGSKFKRAI